MHRKTPQEEAPKGWSKVIEMEKAMEKGRKQMQTKTATTRRVTRWSLSLCSNTCCCVCTTETLSSSRHTLSSLPPRNLSLRGHPPPLGLRPPRPRQHRCPQLSAPQAQIPQPPSLPNRE